MEAVATGLGNHVHHATHGAAKLGLGILPDHLEFLDQIDVRDHDVGRPTDVGVNDSVKEIELRTIFLPMERRIDKTRTRNAHVALDSSDAFVLRGRDRSYAWRKRQ